MIQPEVKSRRCMRLCLIVGSMLCLPIAQAADSQGNFAVKGVANVSCKDYAASAAQGGPELSQYLGHVNGYVSAYNALSVNTFDVLSWQSVDTILLLLLSRCDKHPEVKFGAMLTTLLGYLHEHRVQAVASRVALGPKENSLYLYEPVFKELTQRLQAAGYKQAAHV